MQIQLFLQVLHVRRSIAVNECPQTKTRGFKSGDTAGHDTGPPFPIYQENVCSKVAGLEPQNGPVRHSAERIYSQSPLLRTVTLLESDRKAKYRKASRSRTTEKRPVTVII